MDVVVNYGETLSENLFDKNWGFHKSFKWYKIFKLYVAATAVITEPQGS